jgi:UDP-glucose:(heptosyl)LPS alpha-1,3-glucosyltransferase
MKIALIRRRYIPHGGAERYVENLSRRLTAQGHEVHIFSHSWPETSGAAVHAVPMIGGPGLLKLWSFNRAVKTRVEKQRFDVVQSFEKTWCQDVYRAGEGCHREWLLQRKRYEPVLKTLGVKINPFHWLTLALERRLFERSGTRFFIANAQRGKREILSHYKVDPESVRVIYSAVPETVLLQREPGLTYKSAEKKDLLFVGSGFFRKGLYFLIRALPLVIRERDVHLTVVGRGDEKKAQGLAEKSGVRQHITFVGPVPDVSPYYRTSRVFVLPSIYEPFSNACLEAMAFGLPVVTTEMNGAAEDLFAGVNGFAVGDPSDPVALSASLLQALTLEEEIVRQTHRKVLARHTWERHLEELLKVYELAARATR